MLLTRSRLCPRPKPGSSLHLHVLGTPPAFVLSQDQTLREELPAGDRNRPPHKESSGLQPAIEARPKPHRDAREKTWADPWWDLALAPLAGGPMYTWAPDARRGQSWHRRPSNPARGRSFDGVEPGHTLRSGFDRRVRMLLSFQRPSHRFGRGFLREGYTRKRQAPGRTEEYSAGAAQLGRPPRRRHVLTAQPRSRRIRSRRGSIAGPPRARSAPARGAASRRPAPRGATACGQSAPAPTSPRHAAPRPRAPSLTRAPAR